MDGSKQNQTGSINVGPTGNHSQVGAQSDSGTNRAYPHHSPGPSKVRSAVRRAEALGYQLASDSESGEFTISMSGVRVFSCSGLFPITALLAGIEFDRVLRAKPEGGVK